MKLVGLILGAVAAGLGADLGANDRAHQFERGRFNGSFVGRGDGGFNMLDGRNRYAGKVVRSSGVDGFDVFDSENRYQITIKRW